MNESRLFFAIQMQLACYDVGSENLDFKSISFYNTASNFFARITRGLSGKIIERVVDYDGFVNIFCQNVDNCCKEYYNI